MIFIKKKRFSAPDGWEVDKENLYNLLFNNDNIFNNEYHCPKKLIVPQSILKVHDLRSEKYCYICDDPIKFLYYSEEYWGDGWVRKRICLKCTSRIIGAVTKQKGLDNYLDILCILETL